MAESVIRCMGTGCGKIASRRGLCDSCYRRLIINIKQGNVDWEGAVAAGMCLAAKPKKMWMHGFGRY